ncbi:Bidirectional sugar transporter SWEET7 -like protein [Tripterygium wilfordii]|uniref:Bidirectional sugar transporter SWEET n=1 Tax=Tripterygium wilfordii TaxID=458696 RepID=A0A7J7CLM8_TRIWF|nr:Bidirectional sugar transporter SWEET7 -like protein [Tripterygium wilfordii]
MGKAKAEKFITKRPTFYRIWKKGSVEQYSAAPYLACLVNCMVWVLYGLPMVHPHSTLVVTTNGTGIAIEMFYIVLFLIYSQKHRQRLRVLGIVAVELIFVALLTFLVLHFAHLTNRRTMVVGIVAICFNILMYASPLTVMKLVITTKSVEYMPFILSFVSLLNGVFWSAYGLIRYDFFILLPNGLGSLFALAQLLLYATYYKNTQKILAERKGKALVGLSEVLTEDSKTAINGLNGNGVLH